MLSISLKYEDIFLHKPITLLIPKVIEAHQNT